MSQIQAVHSLLSGIKNGQKSQLSHINVKYSKLSYDVLNVLYEEGYIVNFFVKRENSKQHISIRLKYFNNLPVIKDIQKVSNNYISLKLLNYIDLGLVTYILSTPKGIISAKEARRFGIGGVLLFVVW